MCLDTDCGRKSARLLVVSDNLMDVSLGLLGAPCVSACVREEWFFWPLYPWSSLCICRCFSFLWSLLAAGLNGTSYNSFVTRSFASCKAAAEHGVWSVQEAEMMPLPLSPSTLYTEGQPEFRVWERRSGWQMFEFCCVLGCVLLVLVPVPMCVCCKESDLLFSFSASAQTSCL